MDARTKAIRASTAAILAAILDLAGLPDALAENLCRPVLSLSEVQFSPIAMPSRQRKWTAVVTVDASQCAVNSGGHFDIVFTRLSETAPDLEFRERFAWSPFAQNVALDFAADEAVAEYRIENVTPCICQDQAAGDRAAVTSEWRKQ